MTSTTTRRLRSRPVLVLCAALVIAALFTVVVFVSSDGPSRHAGVQPTDPPRTDAQVWRDAALEDFKAMKGVLVGFTRAMADWQGGRQPGSAAVASIDYSLPQILSTNGTLLKRAPFAKAPRALADYRLAVALYVQAAQLARVGALRPPSPLVAQMKLEYARVRDLADRVFDQANVELSPYLPAPPVIDGVEVQKPAEVPSWASLALAAGPPLDVTPPVAPRRGYLDSRPEQSFAQWSRSVAQAAVPSASSVAAALTNGTTDALRVLSSRLGAASDVVYAAPDPRGERATSTRVQLGLLVNAEATRAAEVATLLPVAVRARMRQVAQALALISDDLWDQRLGARVSGFPRSVLVS